MIGTKTREAIGTAGTRRGSPAGARDDGAGAATPEERATRERRRAALYLDLWERHVAGAAIGGKGIAAPWFAR